MGRVGLPAAALAVAALLLLAACGSSSPPQAVASPAALHDNPGLDPGTHLSKKPAADFTLTDQFGQQVSLNQFRGKLVILSFVDSECTNVCPLTTSEMVEAKTLLGKAGTQVQLLGVDANPDATSVADVKAYSAAHGMLDQWHFMTGSLDQLKSVWKSYGIEVQIVNGDIDHTPALYEIDPQGRLRMVYLSQMSYASIDQQAQLLAQEASQLLPGHPHLISLRSYRRIPPITPHTQVQLPRAEGGGTVSLGPGQARVVVFFATWLTETSNLPAELQQLETYQANSPPAPLVAVDEGSVEPDSQALPSLLHSLPSPLTYPVVVDRTGRIADGYGVQDLLWIAITSKTGKVIWSHDGWVPPATITAHLP